MKLKLMYRLGHLVALTAILVTLVGLSAGCNGCATEQQETFEAGAYKAIGTAFVGYDTSMKIAAGLKQAGTITDGQWTAVADIGTVVQRSGRAASVAMMEYRQAKDAGADLADPRAKVAAALTVLAKDAAQLAAEIQKLTVKK